MKPLKGEVHDAKVADKLIGKVGMTENVIANKGYDSEAIREEIRQMGANPIIPRKFNSKNPNPEFDSYL